MLKRSNIYLTPFAMKRKHIVYKQQSRMRNSRLGAWGLVQNSWNELYFNMMWRSVQRYLTTSAILNYCSLTGTDAVPSTGKRCWIARGYEHKVMCVIYKLGTKAPDLPLIGITIVYSSRSSPYTCISASQHMITCNWKR